MKIATVVGARPQFIKHAPLSKELGKSNHCILVHTGQHYDYSLSRVFFDELGIPEPDYNLEIGSGSHAFQTGEMMKQIESILIHESPDMVLIYGDTNSTLAGALAAVKLHIKLAHVEAGLRVFDKTVPEEVNRVVADYCSNLLFCPTQTAVGNLANENLTKGVFLTGDVMVDSLNLAKGIASKTKILDKLGIKPKEYLVTTLHRASNTDNVENILNITTALLRLAERGQTVVFPVHPRTLKVLKSYGIYDRLAATIKLVEPMGYLEFLNLMSNAQKIITDSGGIQKEAYILKIPCITTMDYTPWIETVDDGWNALAGNDIEKIVELSKSFSPNKPQRNVFGTDACLKIAAIISDLKK